MTQLMFVMCSYDVEIIELAHPSSLSIRNTSYSSLSGVCRRMLPKQQMKTVMLDMDRCKDHFYMDESSLCHACSYDDSVPGEDNLRIYCVQMMEDSTIEFNERCKM